MTAMLCAGGGRSMMGKGRLWNIQTNGQRGRTAQSGVISGTSASTSKVMGWNRVRHGGRANMVSDGIEPGVRDTMAQAGCTSMGRAAVGNTGTHTCRSPLGMKGIRTLAFESAWRIPGSCGVSVRRNEGRCRGHMALVKYYTQQVTSNCWLLELGCRKIIDILNQPIFEHLNNLWVGTWRTSHRQHPCMLLNLGVL